MTKSGYESAWLKEEDLDAFNLRHHDGVPVEHLPGRARGYVETMFGQMYPEAAPKRGDLVAEFGPGVGWIAEAVLDRFSPKELVGLDISQAIATKAHERLPDPRARFTVYDGRTLPFPDGAFDVVYSCATIQHIEKHAAFLLMRELHRVLKPGGHAVLHFMTVHFIPRETIPYEAECLKRVDAAPLHWMHYYSFDELYTWFHDLIKVSDLDIKSSPDRGSFFVHFAGGPGKPFRDPHLPELTYPARAEEALPPSLGTIARSGAAWIKRKGSGR